MTRTILGLSTIAMFSTGCVAQMEDAPFDAEVNVPQDLHCLVH